MDDPLSQLHLSGKFLMCNGCQEATPMQPTVEDIRRLAATLGWTVEGVVSDPAAEDYCPACSRDRRQRSR